MGKLFIEFVNAAEHNCSKHICSSCGCDIASAHDLVWEGFMNTNTPAFLFKRAVNLWEAGPPRQEVLSTGSYTLADVGCRKCSAGLGWRYLWAAAAEQKYKEGSVLLDQSCLLRVSSSWTAKVQTEVRSQGTQTEGGPAAASGGSGLAQELDEYYSW